MATKKHGVLVETRADARQAEPGPSVLLLLVIIMVFAVSLVGTVWLAFFQA